MFDNKAILITGGTGSFGKHFVSFLLKNYPKMKRLVIFSRDELKQYEMSQQFSPSEYECLRYFIGDVRDERRVEQALEGVDFVVHAAAMKQVPASEYNPFECIKTNIIGAQNIINASIKNGVKKVVALSTDKAAAPINLYGATKLCSDKLFTAANSFKGRSEINFSVVRYGNVMGSRGSVIPFFVKRRRDGWLPITDKRMTRFNISLDDGVKMVAWAFQNMVGEEIFVPKIPSYRITDVASAIAPECEQVEVGIRPGEKLHEEMITTSDSSNTLDLGDYYVILPSRDSSSWSHYHQLSTSSEVAAGFSYNSETNTSYLTIDELKSLFVDKLPELFH